MNNSSPLLEVRNLSRHFGAVKALDDCTLSVYPGEVVAFAGDNGAGKTTMIKAISGVYPPTSGEILLDGEPIAFSSPEDAREKGIETIYQDLALADNLSIGANIYLGREPMTKAFDFLPILDRKAMDKATKDMMTLLDFHVNRLDAPVSNFSGGATAGRRDRAGSLLERQDFDHGRANCGFGRPRTAQGHLWLIKSLKAQGKGVISAPSAPRSAETNQPSKPLPGDREQHLNQN